MRRLARRLPMSTVLGWLCATIRPTESLNPPILARLFGRKITSTDGKVTLHATIWRGVVYVTKRVVQ